MTSREGEMWTYKGIDVFPHDLNSMGLRWDAHSPWGRLRADTKQGMRELITQTMADNGITSMRRRRGSVDYIKKYA